MRDPFRPSSSKQLIREAQIAFLVIAALLCVLVYVALHRMSGRKLYFRQIAQTAPIAEHIDDIAYPAQAMRAVGDSLTGPKNGAIKGVNPPKRNFVWPQSNPPISRISPVVKFPRPLDKTPSPRPTGKTVSGSALAVGGAPLVAQANFIEPDANKPKANKPSFGTRSLQFSAPEKSFDDPFENIKPTVPKTKPIRPHSTATRNTPGIPSKKFSIASDNGADVEGDFVPPKIESNFGVDLEASIALGGTAHKESPKPTANHLAKSENKTIAAFPANSKSIDFSPAEPTVKSNPNQSLVPDSTFDSATALAPISTSASVSAPTSTSASASTSTSAPTSVSIAPLQGPAFKPQPIDRSAPEFGDYTVQATDSLWTIAMEFYDDGRFFRALHAYNLDRIGPQAEIVPQMVLHVPELETLLTSHSELCPSDRVESAETSPPTATMGVGKELQMARTAHYDRYEQRLEDRFHTTRSGETLFDIARQQLGQASRYLEIFELNRFRIPDQVTHLTPLKPGLRLLLPE